MCNLTLQAAATLTTTMYNEMVLANPAGVRTSLDVVLHAWVIWNHLHWFPGVATIFVSTELHLHPELKTVAAKVCFSLRQIFLNWKRLRLFRKEKKLLHILTSLQLLLCLRSHVCLQVIFGAEFTTLRRVCKAWIELVATLDCGN